MRTSHEIDENVRVVAAHRYVVRGSLADAKRRDDVAAAKSLEAAISRIDKVTDSLRREAKKAEDKEFRASPRFQGRSSFREKLQQARSEA